MSKVQIQGRTDGATGLLNNLRVDATGAIATTGGGGDSGGDIEGSCERVGLSGYTDVAVGTTTKRLLASTDGRLQVQVVGSSDINGGAPHRHLTIDANGRILTVPLMTATNNKLATKTASEGPDGFAVAVQRLTTSAELIGAQIGASAIKRTLVADANGNLQVGVGGYTDVSDIGTYSRVSVESAGGKGSIFVRGKNSTSTSWNAVVVGGQTNSTVIDCSETTTIRIWGTSSTADPIVLEFAETNPNFSYVEEILPVLVNGTYTINKYYNLSPNYIRFFNMGTAGVNTTYTLFVEQGHD
mgnify:CR=1 FL=1